MSNIIDDEFAIKRPKLIEIVGKEHDYYVRLKDEDNKEQLIKFNDSAMDGKCVMERIDETKNYEVLYSEVYSESVFPSITSFLFDVTSKFDDPPPDAKVQAQILSPLFYSVPYIQRINHYEFFYINYDRSFLDLLNQMDSSKKYSIRFSSKPGFDQQGVYFFKTRAFKRLKNIEMPDYYIDSADFIEFDGENMSFRAHIDSNEAINMKIKKWMSDTNVDYKSITINFLDNKFSWLENREYAEINRNVILNGISVVDKVDNNGTTEHIIQRSDGTVAKLIFKQFTFRFTNEGKTAMMVAKDEVSKEDLRVPIHIIEKIATYFDIKTQRRFAQTCKGAGEIVRRSNRVWPKDIDYHCNRYGVSFAIYYTTSIVDQLYFTILPNEECFISRSVVERPILDIRLTPEMEMKANDIAVKCLFEKLEYLTDDCPHEIKMKLSGHNWPIQLLDLKFFNISPRYVILPTLPFTDRFIAFLKHLDTDREIILGRFFDFEEIPYDRKFFSSDVVREFKYLEINADCEITGRQFIDMKAEVFQIQVQTISEIAVNGKIMKWLEKKQNIKYIGIILKGRDDYSIEEILDGIEYVKTDHKDKFIERYKGFKIRRDDGMEAELLISHKRIVFSTCQLSSSPWSYNYDMETVSKF